MEFNLKPIGLWSRVGRKVFKKLTFRHGLKRHSIQDAVPLYFQGMGCWSLVDDFFPVTQDHVS